MNKSRVEEAFQVANDQYKELGVDVEGAMKKLDKIPISLHCWQADDVTGFENPGAGLSGGGIQATGNFPGKARDINELRQDIEKALSLLPGSYRLNLHAIYGDFGGTFVERDQVQPKHFESWVTWAKQNNVKLDFNCTCFSHPKANDGFSLSSPDKEIRDFWIRHVKQCREISAYMGRELGSPVIHNIWIPDGTKDYTVNRYKYRALLKESLDEIFSVQYKPGEMKDSIESKLFGIGSEAYVVGSHDFYMGYGMTNNKMICLDMGHYHPTESVADKISSVLLFTDEIMLHVSRPERWDSDHVVLLNDELRRLAQEITRAGALDRVHIGLDFFDASINRVGAYAVGTRAARKALLMALLEPTEKLKQYEAENRLFERMSLLEQAKSLPHGAVWDYYCMQSGVPVEESLIQEVQAYEKEVLNKR